jgi:hypothetical protein
MYEVVGEIKCQLRSLAKDGKDDDTEAYLFANQNVYFLKMWNVYYCYHDMQDIAKVAGKKGLTALITDKMPPEIHEGEGGMRLLSNKEIRQLRDIISVSDY